MSVIKLMSDTSVHILLDGNLRIKALLCKTTGAIVKLPKATSA